MQEVLTIMLKVAAIVSLIIFCFVIYQIRDVLIQIRDELVHLRSDFCNYAFDDDDDPDEEDLPEEVPCKLKKVS